MHRAPTPNTLYDRITRLLPFVVGGVLAAGLLIVAAGIRFTGGDPGTDVAGTAVPPAPAASSAPAVTAPASPPSTLPVTTLPATTLPATTATSSPVVSGPTYGGFVTLGVVGEPRSLNPLGMDAATGPVAVLINAVTTGAIRLDPASLDPVALVVEELPTLENGGLEVTEAGELAVRLTIRPDAAWADGTPITFDDFDRTYDVARLASGVHPDVRDKYAAIVPGSMSGAGNTVEFRLRNPGLDWIQLFDVLVPAHEVTVSGFQSAWSESMWVAGGPFRFVTMDGAANRIELAANERSWLVEPDGDDPLPYLEGVTVRYFPTRAELIAALEAGDVHVAAVGGDPATLERLASNESLLLDVQRGPAWEQIGFQLGPGRDRTNAQSVTADADVRRAIGSILDRGAIATEIQGAFGRRLSSIAGVSWPVAGDPVWDALDQQNPIEAADILRGVAVAAETPPVLNFATTANDADREVVARYLVEALEPLGFTVDVSRIEPGAFFLDLIIPGNFEVAAWAWEARPGPLGAVRDLRDRHLVTWPQGTDFYNWDDSGSPLFAEFATGLDFAAGELDYAALADRLAGLERLLVDDAVLIPLYAELNGAAAVVEVRGFTHSILAGGEASTIGQWWLAGG